jgi:hypothetical protein
MTDDEFDRLLEEEDFPWARLAGGEGKRVVAVPAFLSYARDRGLDADEQQLDEQVRRRGGHKETEVWDLGDIPRNLVRTLLRREPKRSPDAYIVP